MRSAVFVGIFQARSLIESFRYAWHGLKYTWLHERNMRIHTVAALTALALAWVLEISTQELIAVSLVSGMVIAAEMANTALEALIDLVIKKRDPLAEVAKNTAAGAVLVTSLAALLVGVAVYGPRMLRYEETIDLVLKKPVASAVGLLGSLLSLVLAVSVPVRKKQ